MTNQGHNALIIDGGSKLNYCTIQIENWTREVQYDNVKRGKVHYPYHKSVHGVGCLGEGKYKSRLSGKSPITKEYQLWAGIITRCYVEKALLEHPTYRNVTVCDEWHNFQNFAKWFYEESNYQKGWDLDKDLFSANSKIYSPETCIFIPHELNSFLIFNCSANTSGFHGVSYSKQLNKYESYISNYCNNRNNQTKKSLGLFDTAEEASNAYLEERKKKALYLREKYKNVLPEKALSKIA